MDMVKSKSYLQKQSFADNFVAEPHTQFKSPTLKEDVYTHVQSKNQRRSMFAH